MSVPVRMKLISPIVALLVSSASLHAAAAGTTTPVAPHMAITVTQGTDMEITVSPDGKTILADLQGLIYSMPFAGGKMKQLTQPFQEASHPDWSPTGGLITLQCYAGGTFHIWTMKPDGTGLKQITFGHGDDREPRISPDGKTIAFSSDRAFKGSYDVWTVDIAGGALKQITSAPADEYEPNWSPDSKSLVFVSGVGIAAASIESIDLATLKQHIMLSVNAANSRVDSPSYSPDGKYLAYVLFAGEGIFMNEAHLVVDTSDGKKHVYTGGSVDAFPFPPTWLAGGDLVYTGDGKILHVNVAASNEVPIAFSAAIPTDRPSYVHKHYDFDSAAAHTVKGIYAPTLSPDGKAIAFVALNQVYLMPLGGKPVALTHDSFYKQGPAFSPDGKTLAYISDKDGIENIYLHDMSAADDSGDKRAAPSMTAQIMPAWSPDGKWMAFQDQSYATMLLNLSTGESTVLAHATFFPGRASFSTNGKTVAIATIKPYTKRFREGNSEIVTVDLNTIKQSWFEAAPYKSVTTRTEDGPTYSPDGKELLFIMEDELYTMPVDADGHPSGKAALLKAVTADAPSYSGDSRHVLYLSNGKLYLLDRTTRAARPIPVPLTYTVAKPTQKILIHAARFWKGSGPDEMKDVDVIVTDNRITGISPHSSTPPAGITRTIEAGDSTVMPGLWENHAHPDSDNGIYYGARMGRLWLAYGVTELKGLADNAYRSVEHRESYLSNTAVGPRLFATGEAVDGERVYYPMMIPTTSEAQLHREFDRLKALDFDFVKLYVRLPYAWAAEGAKFGHDQMGVQSASHYLLPAVDLGEDGMTHISATARTGWAYSRSLTGRSYEDVHKLLVDSRMWTDTTTFSQAPYADDPSMATDSRQGIAPPWENARLKKAVQTAQQGGSQTVAYQHLRDEEITVADDYRRGGLILAGTDSPLDIPATSLHLNLRAQVKFGMAPWQSLETVTSLPAKAYGLDKDLGILAAGHLGDLIITAGDPLTNIDDVARVQCVMKNGILQSVSDIAAPFASVSAGRDICPAKPAKTDEH
jgi:Tol biopolymer transport system component